MRVSIPNCRGGNEISAIVDVPVYMHGQLLVSVGMMLDRLASSIVYMMSTCILPFYVSGWSSLKLPAGHRSNPSSRSHGTWLLLNSATLLFTARFLVPWLVGLIATHLCVLWFPMVCSCTPLIPADIVPLRLRLTAHGLW